MRIVVNTQRLNEVLAAKGLNANSFSRMSNVSVPTSYRIIKGMSSPSARIAQIFAEKLETPFEELFSVEV